MLVSKTPLRISLLGGGTDYPQFFRKNEGVVVGSSINLSVYTNMLALAPSSMENYRFTYRITESVQEIEEFSHPSLRAALMKYNFRDSVNIGTAADVPGNSGMGSSSAFLVGLLTILKRAKSQSIDPLEIAKDAIQIEREILKEFGGWQDQLHASFGSFRSYSFLEDQIQVSEPLISDQLRVELSECLSLIPTKLGRLSSTPSELMSEVFDSKRIHELVSLSTLTRNFLSQIDSNLSLESFLIKLSEAINEAWLIKRHFHSGISDFETDKLIEQIKGHGAMGVKLLGAGSGGYLLVIHKPEFISQETRKFYPEILPIQLTTNGARIYEI